MLSDFNKFLFNYTSLLREIEGDYKNRLLSYVAPANLDQLVVGVGKNGLE